MLPGWPPFSLCSFTFTISTQSIAIQVVQVMPFVTKIILSGSSLRREPLCPYRLYRSVGLGRWYGQTEPYILLLLLIRHAQYSIRTYTADTQHLGFQCSPPGMHTVISAGMLRGRQMFIHPVLQIQLSIQFEWHGAKLITLWARFGLCQRQIGSRVQYMR